MVRSTHLGQCFLLSAYDEASEQAAGPLQMHSTPVLRRNAAVATMGDSAGVVTLRVRQYTPQTGTLRATSSSLWIGNADSGLLGVP
ncbi:hypothetical protein DOTSEDRAFT_72585 [Dothistroma septosporum NZE10]|uniref:Uncharacterized protein n=1 Tax=Dothistroma septosporum (strain NZE10 / CBS 128990) TaxID=675120 RepID=M2YMS0_DOTSN|nr:hypothetical protein DOTSEDRAFT_72585 [Dothistroma septosporum NZE10]